MSRRVVNGREAGVLVSTWRRKAIALFPEFAVAHESPTDFFFDLELMAKEAHEAEDARSLRRIHGFAEWCLHHRGELWDRAAISFYESLFDVVLWEKIVPWLSPFVVAEIRKTWALGDRDVIFNRMVERRREFFYREHVFSTGEIDAL